LLKKELSLVTELIDEGYIQTHRQKNKKIKRADQILPEVYDTTLNCTDFKELSPCSVWYPLKGTNTVELVHFDT
jgi:hypothetical protein